MDTWIRASIATGLLGVLISALAVGDPAAGADRDVSNGPGLQYLIHEVAEVEVSRSATPRRMLFQTNAERLSN